MTTDDAKRALAIRAREARAAAHAAHGEAAARAVRDHVLAWLEGEIGVAQGAVVAGYWSKGDELDIRPTIRRRHT